MIARSIAVALAMVALVAAIEPARAQTPTGTGSAVFVAYYWRAKPGQLDAYNEYIKNVAELIDEDARKAGRLRGSADGESGAGHDRPTGRTCGSSG